MCMDFCVSLMELNFEAGDMSWRPWHLGVRDPESHAVTMLTGKFEVLLV